MSRYPGATWRPLERYKAGNRLAFPMGAHDRIVGHTAVSGATPSMFSYFNVDGRASPHLYFGQRGECEQYIDTAYRSSAVLNGNATCLTWEAWDGYPWPNGVCPPYTPEQVEAMAAFCAWAHHEHGIPLVQLPSSRPGTRGIGWHRMGIDGNFPSPPGTLLGGRMDGGEYWTYSAGKTCPTDQRIRQFPAAIIPRAIEIATGADMPLNDADLAAIAAIADKAATATVNRLLTHNITAAATAPEVKVLAVLREMSQSGERDAKILAAIAAIPAAIGTGATKADVVAAIREVLGSLDT